MKIKRIAIVGGGNAGWICANHLGLELSRDTEIEITLIEAKDIPVIGVGEGSVPFIRNSLISFGISEGDILAHCDATFKTGIKFSNWTNTKANTNNNFYYHMFESPHPGGYDVTPYWLGNRAFSEYSTLSSSYWISENNRTPKRKDSPPYRGVVNYAYHFDAAKLSLLLANNAKRRFGVHHIYETIVAVDLNLDGGIKGLCYESGKYDEFDFYIDCSGFASRLIGDALQVPFIDKSDQILTDTALVVQVPTQQNEEIFPYTKATAHGAGWIWDIPLTTRRGTGFVYSSRHMSDDKAIETFSGYHGSEIDVSCARKIPMKAGFREKFWEKNCVAIGLAQGFVEPLEATSLFLTDFCASLVAKKFPVNSEEIPIYETSSNSIVQFIWARILDFIQVHYYISDRRDTQFWRDVTENIPISAYLSERLEFWKYSIPQPTDFGSSFDFFVADNYLWVLFGMDYPTRAPVLNEKVSALSEAAITNHLASSKKLADSLMSQRDYLTQLKEYVLKNQIR